MSRVDLGLLLNAGLVLVVGYAALYAAGFARSGLEAVWLVGFAYLVGWGLLGVLLTLGLMLGLSAQGFVVASLAAACCRGRRRRPPRARDRAATALERNPFALAGAGLGAAFLAVACVAALLLAVKGQAYADYVDNITFWIPKAESIFYAHGLDAEPLRHAAPSRVPAALPAMNAATFHLVGGFHPSVLPFQMALLGVAFVLAALALLDRFAPRWITLPTLALLVTTPWFWWRLQSPLADQPLAYLVAIGVLAASSGCRLAARLARPGRRPARRPRR